MLNAIEAHDGLGTWYKRPSNTYTLGYGNQDVNCQFASFLFAVSRTRTGCHELVRITLRFAVANRWSVCMRGGVMRVGPYALEQPNAQFWVTTGDSLEQMLFFLADPGITVDGTPYTLVRAAYTDDAGYVDDDLHTLFPHPERRRLNTIQCSTTDEQNVPQNTEISELRFDDEDCMPVDGRLRSLLERGPGR
ncbi:hypothetical protein [Longibacter sp.]|uniref:hypothetical protein n=1 Tax=Longibacter sp. TaxID=2045415 RepID=UPI003EBE017E